MTDQPANSNRAYLFRCWQELPASSGQPAVWRFSMQRVMSRDPPQGLANLGALLAFLQAELGVGPPWGEPAVTGLYHSYVLRCWQEEQASPERPPGRFILQDESDAQRQHAFGSFEQLVAFLRSELLGEQGGQKGDEERR
jgi:hypothetical protein